MNTLHTFTDADMRTMAQHDITPEQVQEQLNRFQTGFPYLRLDASATIGNGILSPDEAACQRYVSLWDEYCLASDANAHPTVVKFVPASGAATRMFKDLYAFLDGDSDVPSTAFEKTFFDSIHDFAFCSELNACCLQQKGITIDEAISRGEYKAVVRLLLTPDGMQYGALPKALLIFHHAAEGVRKAFEEHLAEGAAYAQSNGMVNIHFTVSHEHRALLEKAVAACADSYAEKYGVKFCITYSEQLPSTDTVAADADNQPFREDGTLLFRPGGHGALIYNLNALDADVVFIKNIDNVVPDSQKADTILYKKVLGGILVDVQRHILAHLQTLNSAEVTSDKLSEIEKFVEEVLCVRHAPAMADDQARKDYLRQVLHRPLRVCGMVRNEGEPGGGPFLVYNADGTVSPQILESSQIDKGNERNIRLFKEGTHFNPVDLVCALKDSDGKPFDLLQYVDVETGFISEKSKSGRVLKALELPGLWNGAMSRWNTIFVEVPLSTFNPVKTVNDLLRPAHQGS